MLVECHWHRTRAVFVECHWHRTGAVSLIGIGIGQELTLLSGLGRRCITSVSRLRSALATLQVRAEHPHV